MGEKWQLSASQKYYQKGRDTKRSLGEIANYLNALEADKAELEEMVRLAQPARLFYLLEHGDTDHRVWLSTALNAALSDRPVPEPSGKGRAEIAEAEAAALRKALGKATEVLIWASGAFSSVDLMNNWAQVGKPAVAAALAALKAETPARAEKSC